MAYACSSGMAVDFSVAFECHSPVHQESHWNDQLVSPLLVHRLRRTPETLLPGVAHLLQAIPVHAGSKNMRHVESTCKADVRADECRELSSDEMAR